MAALACKQEFKKFLEGVPEGRVRWRCECKAGGFNSEEFQLLAGVVLFTEFFIVVRRGKLMFQPHVHMLLFGTPKMFGAIHRWWQQRCPQEVALEKLSSKSIAKALSYANAKEKRDQMWEERDRWRILDRFVIQPVERETGRRAVMRWMGGPALSPHGFRKIRAEATRSM